MLIALEAEKLQRAMMELIADRHRTRTMRQLLTDFAEAHAIPL